jgi:hypothetical protein
LFGLKSLADTESRHPKVDSLGIDFATLFSVATGKEIRPYPSPSRFAHGPWPDVMKVETADRKAFSQLRKDGLIVTRRGAGAVVK